MNINYKESQIELFSNAGQAAVDPRRPRVFAAQLVLSAENLVILTICSILVIIFAFSLGVERGKRVAVPGVQDVASAVKPAVLPAEESSEVVVPSAMSKALSRADMAKARPEAQPVKALAQKTVLDKPNKPVDQKMALAKPDVKSPVSVSVPAAKAAPAGSFTVQVASYKGMKHAEREAALLKQKGFNDVYVVKKGQYVIVCVGSFGSRDGAVKLTKKLRNRYQDPSVRSL